MDLQSFDRSLEDDQIMCSLLRLKTKEDPSTTDINSVAFSLFEKGSFVSFLQFSTNARGTEPLQLIPVERLPISVSHTSAVSRSSNSILESVGYQDVSEVQGVIANEAPAMIYDALPKQMSKHDLKIFESKFLKMVGCKSEPAACCSDEDSDEDLDEDSNKDSNNMCRNKTKDCCRKNNCGKQDDRPPYARTMPEDRRFGLVITNSNSCDDVDLDAIMTHFSKLFEHCVIPDLSFSICTSFAKFGKHLLIVCEDDSTAGWVISALSEMCPRHTCEPFIEFFDLKKCTFVLPYVIPDKPLCNIFELMETQNTGLETFKWTVTGQCPVDPCEDGESIVSELCTNYIVLGSIRSLSQRV
ncbi:uncharacterized protein LOC121530260 [Drosophila eugracilis]|uniref:uncharacterized protein LOC121530260 n=1 Tax=Drosophila eugracilis TaxID=29029 RepID=UPI001BD93880|nr:uncharacterized protein LOC121530260 [Drosophila eugracilis]